MAKKSKDKIKASKTGMDHFIEELIDDEDEIADNEDVIEFKETQLSQFLKQKQPRKKSAKGSVPAMKYQEFIAVSKGESMWKELQASVDNLKNFYMHQLNVRSSTSLDELPVMLEG